MSDMGNDDKKKILVEIAKLIWREKITVGQFFEIVGQGVADIPATQISAMISAWNTQHPDDEGIRN